MGEMADYVNEIFQCAEMDREAEFQRRTGQLPPRDFEDELDLLTEEDEEVTDARRS